MPDLIGNANDSGFCLTSAETVACFGKENNMAVLPARGVPTTETDMEPTGFPGLTDAMTLTPGESYSFSVFTCTATAGGMDCVSNESGASISVAGSAMLVTPPTR